MVKLDEIGAGESTVLISADQVARNGLVARFDLVALDNLEAEIALSRDTSGVLAKGRIRATLSQYCVATGEPVLALLDEPMEIHFVPELAVAASAEVELNADDCDTMFYDGQSIDLGEAVAQSLGLALDPYPRSSDAHERLQAAGVKAEDEIETLGALAGLKDMLTKK